MNLESIKSVVLAVLVIMSLILTLSIWTFSDYDEINEDITKNISINGQEADMNDVILPSQVVFHQQNQSYQFTEKTDQVNFYQDLKEWNVLFLDEQKPLDNLGQSYVELIFPTEIPLSLLPNMFNVTEDSTRTYPDWAFNRMIVKPNHDSESLSIWFRSTNHNQVLNVEVQDSKAYASVVNQAQSHNDLSELITYEVNNRVIYLPEEKPALSKQTFTTNSISIEPLINNLFQASDNVRETSDGRFTDGTRMLEEYEVFSHQNYMRFVNPRNPNTTGNSFMRDELITESILFLNNHDGWTHDYMLTEISDDGTTIEFQMLFDGHQVISQLGHIEQSWVNRELNTYIRPLMRLSTSLSHEEVSLRSGEDIRSLLEAEPRMFPEKTIEDIQIVYTMSEEEGFSSDIISLEPKWFIKQNGRWAPIPKEDEMLEVQGGKKQ
ncbi:Two-component signal transduction system YycFG, regulatory protein YycH [Salinibacillus kushneri]|uniref:Two-component signal transduction system YycFG, regulatory protein YycH n=1 Tax=Salinibacillus kushneri TaxID=237682 RepID=A0A1I0C893_9BACI|nr:two-component system activity regulator YycH [Salinibacillus kushneri]SET15753.1 Two-component signal transduction system YycFG, regulatory protein YycH [Salinibacillus kushneri]